jgi:hypothetical protein
MNGPLAPLARWNERGSSRPDSGNSQQTAPKDEPQTGDDAQFAVTHVHTS